MENVIDNVKTSNLNDVSTLNADNEQNGNFGFFTLLSVLRRFWILILVCTVIGTALGLGLAVFKDQTYYTQSRKVICIARINDKAMITNISLTNRLIPTIKDQVKTQIFIDEANNLYKEKYGSRSISASAINFEVGETLIFKVSYTDVTKELAEQKLNVYIAAVKKVYENQGSVLTTGDEVSFEAIDGYSTSSSSNGFTKFVLLGVAGGIAIGLVLALLLYLMDNTVSNKDDLERLTGANVIAFIDDVKN